MHISMIKRTSLIDFIDKLFGKLREYTCKIEPFLMMLIFFITTIPFRKPDFYRSLSTLYIFLVTTPGSQTTLSGDTDAPHVSTTGDQTSQVNLDASTASTVATGTVATVSTVVTVQVDTTPVRDVTVATLTTPVSLSKATEITLTTDAKVTIESREETIESPQDTRKGSFLGNFNWAVALENLRQYDSYDVCHGSVLTTWTSRQNT